MKIVVFGQEDEAYKVPDKLFKEYMDQIEFARKLESRQLSREYEMTNLDDQGMGKLYQIRDQIRNQCRPFIVDYISTGDW